MADFICSKIGVSKTAKTGWALPAANQLMEGRSLRFAPARRALYVCLRSCSGPFVTL